MPEMLLGAPIASTIYDDLKKRIAAQKQRGIFPKLSIILIGDHAPSQVYVGKKQQKAKELGMLCDVHKFDKDADEKTVIHHIKKLNTNNTVSGIIIQLPIPEHLYTPRVLNAVNPQKDVDCLTNENLGKLIMNTPYLNPPTPAAVLALIQKTGQKLAGAKVAVVGIGALVGKPLAIMLANARASVRTINSATPDSVEICQNADIIVSGVGKSGIITTNHIGKNSIVIDAGIESLDGKVLGDVAKDTIDASSAAFITPTPGGVGPLTVAMLLQNTVIASEKNTASKKIFFWKR